MYYIINSNAIFFNKYYINNIRKGHASNYINTNAIFFKAEIWRKGDFYFDATTCWYPGSIFIIFKLNAMNLFAELVSFCFLRVFYN